MQTGLPLLLVSSLFFISPVASAQIVQLPTPENVLSLGGQLTTDEHDYNRTLTFYLLEFLSNNSSSTADSIFVMDSRGTYITYDLLLDTSVQHYEGYYIYINDSLHIANPDTFIIRRTSAQRIDLTQVALGSGPRQGRIWNRVERQYDANGQISKIVAIEDLQQLDSTYNVYRNYYYNSVTSQLDSTKLHYLNGQFIRGQQYYYSQSKLDSVHMWNNGYRQYYSSRHYEYSTQSELIKDSLVFYDGTYELNIFHRNQTGRLDSISHYNDFNSQVANLKVTVKIEYDEFNNVSRMIYNSINPSYFVYYEFFYINRGVGLKESCSLSEINVYPNPFSEELTIQISNQNVSSLIMNDMLGRDVQVPICFLDGKIVLNTSGIAGGVYLLTLIGKDFNETIRLIKS